MPLHDLPLSLIGLIGRLASSRSALNTGKAIDAATASAHLRYAVLRESANGGILDERSDKSFLGTEPLGRLMAHFAVPTIVAQTVGLLHNIVDRVFTGRIAGIGADALTGVGIAPPLSCRSARFRSSRAQTAVLRHPSRPIAAGLSCSTALKAANRCVDRFRRHLRAARPFALALPRFLGAPGAYLARPVSDVSSATPCAALALLNFKRPLRGSALERVG